MTAPSTRYNSFFEQGNQNFIIFAEQMMQLLDRGNFVATYKYAVLLGLMDLCLEHTSKSGEPPQILTTRQLALKVLELYWPQSRAYKVNKIEVLKQSTGNQAKIISDICAFKERLQISDTSLHQADLEQPEKFEKLVDKIEWTLISMPLPRVQVVGRRSFDIIYKISWDLTIEKQKKEVVQYQKGKASDFDNRIHLIDGVGGYLVMLSGLLRPLIHREWIRMVAQINKLQETKLEKFLFGADRVSTAVIRNDLIDIQHGRCFYCGEKLKSKVEIDHFVPWSRYPNNSLENLVAAHQKCNHSKRDFLASSLHLVHWASRLKSDCETAKQLTQLAKDKHWENDSDRSLGVARGIYLRLPEKTLLWQNIDEFVEIQRAELKVALA